MPVNHNGDSARVAALVISRHVVLPNSYAVTARFSRRNDPLLTS